MALFVLQTPLLLGADIVVHSHTKFLNGHADIVGGIVVPKSETDYKKIRPVMVTMGCNMDPHQAFLTRRGLKTLGIRIDCAQENASKVAQYLEAHPKVGWINYPGFASHPQYALGKKLMNGPGSMMSFGLKGGLQAGKKLMEGGISEGLVRLSIGIEEVEDIISDLDQTLAKI